MVSVNSSRETKNRWLRTATAVAVCLHGVRRDAASLNQPGLAVWSCYMVLVQYAFTSFQKGVERVLGRGLGIIVALVLGRSRGTPGGWALYWKCSPSCLCSTSISRVGWPIHF